MNTLTITSDDGKILVQCLLGNIDPSRAIVAVIQALDKLPPPKLPRAKRRDAGKPRATPPTQA